MSADQWARWHHAMAGNRIETERGNPASGYYRNLTGKPAPQDIEAVCIYRDEDGKLQCIRNVIGDGSWMDADQIEELFASICFYPISHELYLTVTEQGQPWPVEYGNKARLSGKDQAAGVAWTPEYGRRRLGLDLLQAEAKPFGDGGNTEELVRSSLVLTPSKPFETIGESTGGHKLDGEQTPDKVMFAEISALGASVKTWLAEIGGQPKTETDRAKIADFKTTFSRLNDKADAARKNEKKPFWDAGKAVDEKWKRITDHATKLRDRCASIYTEATKAEEARRIGEAEQAGSEAKPVEAAGNLRRVPLAERTIWSVIDPRAYARHLIESNEDLPSELVDTLSKIAGRRGVDAPGISKTVQRSAA